MIRVFLHRFFTWMTSCRLACFLLVFLLSACDNTEDMASSKEGNYSQQASCWQLKIIEIVTSQIDNLFDGAAAKVANGGPGVIMIGFAIWMAFRLLKILPSFKEENLGEIWSEIGQKLFFCSFCAWAVSSLDYITWTLNTFVTPLYNTILELASDIIAAPASGQTAFNLGEFGNISFNGNYNSCEVAVLNMDNIRNTIRPMANCLACQISERLNGGIRVGVSLIASLDLVAMFVGLFMMFVFTVAKFVFVFFLVDSLFRLNFAVFLFPLLIMGVPFSYTRKWSKFGLEMFLNSSGIMLFMGILITVAVSSLEFIFTTYSQQGVFKEETFAGQGPVLLSLVLISVLLFDIPPLASALADKFIGGGQGFEFQKQVSKFAVNTAKRAGAAALGAVTAGATKVVTDGLEKYEVTREALDKVKNLKSNINSKINTMAGYNDD